MAKVLIYTMNGCGYCDAAKALLKSKGLSYTEENISDDDDKKFELIKKTNHRTLPQIFIDDEFIGGYTDLKAYLDEK
jgi:glutaredoxin 3